MFPLAIAAVGMVGSIVGALLVRARGHSLHTGLHVGTWVAMGITVVGVGITTLVLFGDVVEVDNPLGLFLAVIVGLAVGYVIGWISEIFTSDRYRVVKEVARQAQTGPATVVLSGIAAGMRSAAFSVVVDRPRDPRGVLDRGAGLRGRGDLRHRHRRHRRAGDAGR